MASVTFPIGLGGDGSTVTDDDNATTGLREGGWRTRFVPCLSNTVAIADQITSRTIFGSDTSSTSTLVVAGTKTFTTAGLLVWAPGMFVTIARTSAAVATNMYGQVTAYNPTTKQLTVNVTSIVGSGTYTDWTISIAPPGLAAFSFTGATTIAVNSASDALKVTQSGAGNAFVVEDAAATDPTPFVIDGDGFIVAGHTAKINSASLGYAKFQIVGTDNQTAQAAIWRFSADGDQPRMVFYKSRTATIGGNIAVGTGEPLGSILFYGADNSNYVAGASISASVDGTVTAGGMPTRLLFSTTPAGASSSTTRMVIRSDGNIGIGSSYGGSAAGTIASNKTLTGNAVTYGIIHTGQVQTDSATAASYFFSQANVAGGFAAALPNLRHFYATQGTLSSSVNAQMGFGVDSSLVNANNNYGFYSNIPGAAGRWNIYIAGTADNYFAGPIKSNTTIAGGYTAHAAGTTAMALGSNNVVKVTPNATATYTTTVAPAGAEASVIIVTSGTTSYTITFGTGFLVSTNLLTGTTTARTFVLNFVSDGTTMIETSRTVAL